jgi:PPM family protein phosphatase
VTALRCGAATDTGLVRRNNQDFLLVAEGLFAVADGMGGHAGGEVASRVAVATLQDAFGSDHHQRTADHLLDAVRAANNAVYERSQADASLRGMGTTLTAAALVVEGEEERIAVANVGDSRAYVFAQGDLTQLTEDHSVPEELVRQGALDPDEVGSHPQRHILTRAMGILPDVQVDLWEVLPIAGDRLLLCSDGLVREVTDDQIASVLRRLADPAEAADELVARARAAGGSDNITVVIIDVVDDDDLALRASEALAGESSLESTARPEPDAGEAATGGGQAVTFPGRRRRLTLRVVLFVVVLLAIVAAAGVAVTAYARGTYFVTLGAAGTATGPLAEPGAQPLVIDKGRPGGLLWFRPTRVETTTVLSTQVLPSRLPDLRKGKVVGTLGEARTYVANLLQEAARAAPSP